MRSATDAKKTADTLGVGPIKLISGFVLTIVACTTGFAFLGQTVAERILWGMGGLAAGLGAFLFVFTFFLVRTPWKFENEMLAENEKTSETLARNKNAELDDLRKQLEVRKKDEKSVKLELARWIKSGQDLFDSLFALQPPPIYNIPRAFKVPAQMTEHIIEWQKQVDDFVKKNFPDFLNYVDRDGIPPFPPVLNPIKDGMFDLWRREIGVRVERLREKSSELSD